MSRNKISESINCVEKEFNLKKLLDSDPYLCNYEYFINDRFYKTLNMLKMIDNHEDYLVNKNCEKRKGVDGFSKAHLLYGVHCCSDGSIECMEWCPGVDKIYLYGEFNDWNKRQYEYEKLEYGKWKLTISPSENGKCKIPHNSILKLNVVTQHGEELERISPYARYVTKSKVYNFFDWRFIDPFVEPNYVFSHKLRHKPDRLRIYEVHIGISSAEETVASYEYFTQNILPRVIHLGYNTIQIMAIMEHAYYASFGYQITSFFAASSRYGRPNELKKLIDTAHGLGLVVLLDIVHSHASCNSVDGLNSFNGTDSCHFHSGELGKHDTWNTRLFNYTEYEVLRFLMSNLFYWIDEFHFDGFRFDGISSMMYKGNAITKNFDGHYDDYYSRDIVDTESLSYLMAANFILHKVFPNIITIAEDVSGIPALCIPVQDGGIGFDYRLAMGLPDMWIKLFKKSRLEDWDMDQICYTLCRRRYGEKHIAYAESHDQALVGDKTIAFWLMDSDMYHHMSVLKPSTLVIDQGIALHKMIRLIVSGLGGESYLNFIGNEWGHPEWLDFPRENNNESYHYARRLWHLVDDKNLKYKFMYEFDRAMNMTEQENNWLSKDVVYISKKDQGDKIIIFERPYYLVWAFNFHINNSYPDYGIGVNMPGEYKLILNSDEARFGGLDRIDMGVTYKTTEYKINDRNNMLKVSTNI